MSVAAAATVAAPIVGGIVGNIMSKGSRDAQKKAMKEAYATLAAIGFPPDLSKEIIMQKFQQVGIMTPDLEEDLSSSMPESELAKIKEDEGLKSTQLQALGRMGQLSKTGLGAEDRAALNQIRAQVQRDAEAKRQQVASQMAAQGMGRSGASLVGQLMAGQEAQNLASQQSDQVAAQAQARALQALMSQSQMSGQLQQQGLNVQETAGRALDERNRFLQENSIARQRANVGALNAAQAANLAEQQRAADANTQLANAEKLRQSAEQGQYYDRKLGYGQALSNAKLGQASNYANQAANTAGMFAGIGQSLGQGAAAYGQFQSQRDQTNMLAADKGLTRDAQGNWIKGKA